MTMTALQNQAELKFHTVDKTPLIGATFKTTFKHLDNHYHYEIFVRVPYDHQQTGATYESIEGSRMMKIASVGNFQTQGLAMQVMIQRIAELLKKVQR
jgi:hypothetical protein